MKKAFIVIFVSLAILIILFIFLRPPDVYKLPASQNDSSQPTPNIWNVKTFSDKKTTPQASTTGTTGKERPAPTPKPLPYPRISINYSTQRVSSIGNNNADKNSTFTVIRLDIRNYGYKYFDAFPNNFRGIVKKAEVIPLVNISTGDTIDDVIPNNSRAKGDLIFLTSKKDFLTKIIYSPVSKSESYNILYKSVSQAEIDDKTTEVARDDED